MMIGTHKTKVFKTKDDFTIVKYQKTEVVKFDGNHIILNTGGWCYNTTKNRMNQTSLKFDLGYHIFQKDFEWFIVFNNKKYLMYETTVINRKTKSVYDLESGQSLEIGGNK